MIDGSFEILRDLTDDPTVSLPNPFNTCSPHFHRQIELLYVVSGSNQVTVGENTKVLFADQLCIADSFDVHSMKSIGENSLSISLIVPYFLTAQYIKEKGDKELSANFITDTAIAKKFLNIINIMYENLDTSSTLVLNGLMTGILGLIIKYLPFTENTLKKNYMLINKILYYLEDNFHQQITLDSISAYFGYSRYYFSKLFNDCFYCNFNTYLNSLRARNAITLLATTDCSVLDAAMRSGFPSMPTFYRYFQLHYQANPLEIVKNLNDKEKYYSSISSFKKT